MKEGLEHALWGRWGEWGSRDELGQRDELGPRDERGQQERRESVLSQVQGSMELLKMKMKLRALLWAWEVSECLYSCNVMEPDKIP